MSVHIVDDYLTVLILSVAVGWYTVELDEKQKVVKHKAATIEAQQEEIRDLKAIISHGRQLIRERSQEDGEQWERMNTLEETGP